jgi:hypothetical protein
MLMTQHPTEELLASFVDERLDSATREPVTEHLAWCGECREIVLMATAYQVEEPADVTRGSFGASRWTAALGGLAAAAAIAVFALHPSSIFGYGVDDVVAASQTLKTRASDGRFAGGFAYSKEPSTMRGAGDSEPLENIEDLGTKAELLTIKSKLKEDSDPHILGLIQLFTAEKGKKDVSDAVTSLEIAHGAAHGAEHDSIGIDLAAALIAYANWSGHPDENNARALELSDDVLKRLPKSPEALWNRAIALQSLDRNTEAVRAWDNYLKVDPNSSWAEEATRRKTRLQSDF